MNKMMKTGMAKTGMNRDMHGSYSTSMIAHSSMAKVGVSTGYKPTKCDIMKKGKMINSGS